MYLGLLSGGTVFSKLDANSGFYQIKLSNKSQLLTAFITPYGRYLFQRLPFSITLAPEYFQKLMSEILTGMPGVVNFIDGILSFGRMKAEHDQHLEKTLEKLEKECVTLNKVKCCFGVTEVAFLGCLINKERIKPNPNWMRLKT